MKRPLPILTSVLVGLLGICLCAASPSVAAPPAPAPSPTASALPPGPLPAPSSTTPALPRGPAPAPSPTTPALPPGASPAPPTVPSAVPPTVSPVPAQLTLTLEDAIRLALEHNVNVLLATERINEARGQETQSRAALLPHLSLSLLQANLTQNLAALGLPAGFLPGSLVIGPYGNFDLRLHLVQSIFDQAARVRLRAARLGIDVSRMEERLARQQVIAAAGLAYVNADRTERAQAAAQSTVDLARSLLKLAVDQREAGLASGLDVTRAETRLTQELLKLAQTRTAAHSAMLHLKHTVGLPLDVPLHLANVLRYFMPVLPEPSEATAMALKDRVEVQIALARLQLAQVDTRLARAQNQPTVGVYADYGMSGNTPTKNDFPTHNVGVQVQVPLLDGGLTRGREQVATSRLRQVEYSLRDLRVQVEQDVRDAILTLQVATEQVQTAEQAVTLAERELQMARDRFAAGLGDNIEVLGGQAALATALDARVAALALYHSARINLASATGRLESLEWTR